MRNISNLPLEVCDRIILCITAFLRLVVEISDSINRFDYEELLWSEEISEINSIRNSAFELYIKLMDEYLPMRRKDKRRTKKDFQSFRDRSDDYMKYLLGHYLVPLNECGTRVINCDKFEIPDGKCKKYVHKFGEHKSIYNTLYCASYSNTQNCFNIGTVYETIYKMGFNNVAKLNGVDFVTFYIGSYEECKKAEELMKEKHKRKFKHFDKAQETILN